MFSTWKKIKMIAQCLIGMMIVGAWLASTCPAAEHTAKTAKVTIRQFTPAELNVSPSNIRAEDVFDVVGTLNAIDGNQITIGDKRLTLASNVSASGIPKWSEVGVTLNKAGEVTVLEIVSNQPH